MTPANFDAMIQDVSKSMARSQFLRRLSSNSSSASASGKRGSKRVVKVKSVGNSPHNTVQRRKTTASHSARTSNSAAQDYNYQVSEQRRENAPPLRELLPSARPMSWHPGSRASDTLVDHFPSNEPALKNTIAGFRNLAVAGTQTSSNDHLPQNALPIDPIYLTNDPPRTYGQSTSRMEGYEYFEPDAGNTYLSYPNYSLAGQSHYLHNHLLYGCPSYSSRGLAEPEWRQTTSNFTSCPGSQPADMLPIQNSSDHAQIPASKVSPQIAKKGSKELWGMGLYDHNASSLDFSASPPLHFAILDRESIGTEGKGLKLEETWSPSKHPVAKDASDVVKQQEEEEDEEEEAYSTDEADEDLVPIMNPTPGMTEPQAFLYPGYGDLSNQTFFFDSDDPYTDCLAFDHQAAGICQEPKLPDASYGGREHGNFLWI